MNDIKIKEEKIKQKYENIIKGKVIKISKITTGKYNEVYKIESEKNVCIFRIFPTKEWPEEGKLKFVNDKLRENNIVCAKIFEISYEDGDFENGFMIEEFVEGNNANDLYGNVISQEYYENMAKLVSRFHNIGIKNYGYIGKGVANHKCFMDFIYSDIKRFFNNIEMENIFTKKEEREITNLILTNLKPIEELPSVLCHNDIHPGNVIIRNREFVLLDWDNAVSSNWIQDFSTMTYWIQLLYKKDDYKKIKKLFLENYATDYMKKDLDIFEVTFHLLIGINLLSHFKGNKELFEKALKNLKEKIDFLSNQ